MPLLCAGEELPRQNFPIWRDRTRSSLFPNSDILPQPPLRPSERLSPGCASRSAKRFLGSNLAVASWRRFDMFPPQRGLLDGGQRAAEFLHEGLSSHQQPPNNFLPHEIDRDPTAAS